MFHKSTCGERFLLKLRTREQRFPTEGMADSLLHPKPADGHFVLMNAVVKCLELKRSRCLNKGLYCFSTSAHGLECQIGARYHPLWERKLLLVIVPNIFLLSLGSL